LSRTSILLQNIISIYLEVLNI